MKGGALSPVTIHLSSKIAPGGWALKVKYKGYVCFYILKIFKKKSRDYLVKLHLEGGLSNKNIKSLFVSAF